MRSARVFLGSLTVLLASFALKCGGPPTYTLGVTDSQPGPQGATIATGQGASTRPPRQVIQQRTNDSVESLAFSPDGRWLAVATNARVVTVWDANTRALLRTLRVTSILPPIAVDWSGDRAHLAVGQGESILLDPEREAVSGEFLDAHGGTGEVSHVRRVSGVADASWAGFDGTDVALFDAQGHPVRKLRWPTADGGRPDLVHDIAAAGRGHAVAAITHSAAFVWNLDRPSDEGRAVAIDGQPVQVAVATSGDFAFVAVNQGASASRVDVIDMRAGRVVRRLQPDPQAATDGDAITSVAVSPDGAVAIGGSTQRVTAWNVATGDRRWVVDADTAVIRARHDLQAMVEAVAVSPNTPLVAAGNARGDIFFLDLASGRPMGELGIAVRRPMELQFSADNQSLLALSDMYATRWSLSDAKLTGSYLAPGAEAVAPLPGNDFAIGRAPLSLRIPTPLDPPLPCPIGTVPLYVARWSNPDELRRLTGDRGRGVKLSGDKERALTSGGSLCVSHLFGIMALHPATQRALVDLRPDGLAIADLTTGKPVALQGSQNYLFSAALSKDGQLAVASRLDAVSIWDARNGQIKSRVPIPSGWTDVKAALSPDGAYVALAGELLFGGAGVAVYPVTSAKPAWTGTVNQPIFSLAFAAQGTDVWAGGLAGSIGLIHEGQVSAVLDGTSGGGAGRLALSNDGQLLASMHQDGGVRIWDVPRRALRATLIDYDDGEWLIATPGGAFTGTGEAARRVGWVFESPLELFGFEQFAADFQKDGIVGRRLSTGLGDANAILGRPPEASLVRVSRGAPGRVVVRVSASSAATVDSVLAFRDGRPIDTRKLGVANGEATFDLPELAGENRFTFSAVDDRGFASNPVTVDAQGAATPRPALWVVSVGISTYPTLAQSLHDPDINLRVADLDAQAIAQSFTALTGSDGPFAPSHGPTTLVNEKATVNAILAAIRDLAHMRPDDLAVIFLAGHGVKIGDAADMRFLTSAADANVQSLGSNSVGWGDIAAAIGAAPGRVLVLLDACHGGHISQENVVPNGELAARLAREGRAGVIVFAASKGRQDSRENPRHGFFTQALLDTLGDPAADRDRNGHLDLSELIDSVTILVDKRTGGAQTPWVSRRELFGDFPIASTLRGP